MSKELTWEELKEKAKEMGYSTWGYYDCENNQNVDGMMKLDHIGSKIEFDEYGHIRIYRLTKEQILLLLFVMRGLE